MITVLYEAEVYERLVGSAVFNTVGTDELRPAGSIPVHLRSVRYLASTHPPITDPAGDPHLVEAIDERQRVLAGNAKRITKIGDRKASGVSVPEQFKNGFEITKHIGVEVHAIVSNEYSEAYQPRNHRAIVVVDWSCRHPFGKKTIDER